MIRMYFEEQERKARSLSTQENYHATFTQNREGMWVAAQQDDWNFQGEASANCWLSEARCYHFIDLNFAKNLANTYLKLSSDYTAWQKTLY